MIENVKFSSLQVNSGSKSPTIGSFLEYCELDRNLSPLTVKMYAYYLRVFADWLGEKEINEESIREYRLYLSRYVNPVKGPLAKSTQNYFLIAVRAFLRYLTKKGVKTLAPDQIELGKNRDRQVKFLTREQLNKLVMVIDTSTNRGLRDRAILELLFSTGLRVAELIRLDKDKIDLKSCELGIVGKGGRIRVVFISDRAAKSLSRYLTTRQDQVRALFINYHDTANDKRRLTAWSIEWLVRKYAEKAKLPIRPTPHTLRHTFATDLLRNGADLRSVQELLGHKNVATTQIYTHVTNPQLKEVFSKFHDK